MRYLPALTAAALCLLPLGAPFAQQARAPSANAVPDVVGQAFTVSGIDVDVHAKSTSQARDAAFLEAPRQAWPRLWTRLTGGSAEEAPKMSDSALSAMVDGIEIEQERLGNGRYIARLGVAFNRQRAGRRLPASARIVRSEPVLLIPVLYDGGADTTYDPDSPWLQAWSEVGPGSSVMDYIKPRGTAGDRLLVDGWQATRGDRRLWRQILSRYEAQNVVTAEARLRRSYPGGPIAALFIARYGPDAKEIERFSMRAASTGELPEMLGDAVKRIDNAYARALERGLIGTETQVDSSLAAITAPAYEIDDGYEALGEVSLSLPTPTMESWTAAEKKLLALGRSSQVVLSSLQIGGRSAVNLNWRGTEGELRAALASAGFAAAGQGGTYALSHASAPAAGSPPAATDGQPTPNEAPAQAPQSAAPQPSPEAPQPLLPSNDD